MGKKDPCRRVVAGRGGRPPYLMRVRGGLVRSGRAQALHKQIDFSTNTGAPAGRERIKARLSAGSEGGAKAAAHPDTNELCDPFFFFSMISHNYCWMKCRYPARARPDHVITKDEKD